MISAKKKKNKQQHLYYSEFNYSQVLKIKLIVCILQFSIFMSDVLAQFRTAIMRGFLHTHLLLNATNMSNTSFAGALSALHCPRFTN